MTDARVTAKTPSERLTGRPDPTPLPTSELAKLRALKLLGMAHRESTDPEQRNRLWQAQGDVQAGQWWPRTFEAMTEAKQITGPR